VSGHSHKPSIQTRDGVIFLNPGSSGPRRFNLPVTVALVTSTKDNLTARIVDLLI
jgi:predicted phosphodiesterase